MQKATVAYSIYTLENFPWTEMNDETTAPPNHLNLSLSKHSTEPTTHQAFAPSSPIWLNPNSMFVTDRFVFSASAKAWRQRQIKAGILFVGSTVKTWSLKSWEQICKYEKNTFNSDMWISLMRNLANNGNQPRNSHFLSPSTCSKKSPRSTMNDETPAHPPNHPNLSLSDDVRDKTSYIKYHQIMTFCSNQRKLSPHTRPWHPRHQSCTNLVPFQIDVCDGSIYLQCLGHGLETETDQSWRLDLSSTDKTW